MALDKPIELKRKSAKPLYSQIQDHIYQQITIGALRPGDQLPAEIDLAKQYEVGRITVRRAITDLVESGLLNRQAGKGTFVSSHKIERHLVNVDSFTARMLSVGLQPRSKVLSNEISEANVRLAAELQVEPKSPVLEVARLRFSDQEPVMLERAYLSLVRCPGLDEYDLNTVSLYQLLQEKWDLVPVKSRKTLELTYATEWEAEHLQVSQGTPLFFLRATVLSENSPIEYVSILMRGDRFRFQI